MLDDEQCDILLKVIQKEASLNDIKVLSKRAKQIGALKMLFARLTNTDTWAGAQQRYPSQATVLQLEHFVESDLKKGVPKAFQDFCQRVVSTTSTSSISTPAADHVYVHSSEQGQVLYAAVIVAPYPDISGHMLQTIDPHYSGADLAIVQTEVHCTFYFCCAVHMHKCVN